MTSQITLYDIAFKAPVEANASAPNPWKARYALNFKALNYKTHWVPLPDVSKVRQQVGAPACRKLANGEDFYTLPMITDPHTDSLIGDSLDIAIHLQQTYPEAGAGDLFPAQTLDYKYTPPFDFPAPLSSHAEDEYGEYVRFNTNVDNVFSAHCILATHGMPLDPARADEVKAEFVRRSGLSSWDDFGIQGERREQMKESFRKALTGVGVLLKKDPSGPFILGSRPSYADLILGGWLQMMSKTLPQSEWEEMIGWHDGVLGDLHRALERFAEVK
ncbi:hypothetical protein N7488_008659 [Penicillium malachiteum]|nr:hypothetical protein N7488_008659 [Penicillium malachiteum]